MIIGPNEPLPTPPAPYEWARVDKEPVADFEQIENCISFAENEGYEEWAKGAKAELELYRARCSAVEQERDGLLADWKAMAESLEADHLEEVRALTAERDEWRRWFELRQASSAAAGARAEAAEQALAHAMGFVAVVSDLDASLGLMDIGKLVQDARDIYWHHEAAIARAALVGREETE